MDMSDNHVPDSFDTDTHVDSQAGQSLEDLLVRLEALNASASMLAGPLHDSITTGPLDHTLLGGPLQCEQFKNWLYKPIAGTVQDDHLRRVVAGAAVYLTQCRPELRIGLLNLAYALKPDSLIPDPNHVMRELLPITGLIQNQVTQLLYHKPYNFAMHAEILNMIVTEMFSYEQRHKISPSVGKFKLHPENRIKVQHDHGIYVQGNIIWQKEKDKRFYWTRNGQPISYSHPIVEDHFPYNWLAYTDHKQTFISFDGNTYLRIEEPQLPPRANIPKPQPQQPGPPQRYQPPPQHMLPPVNMQRHQSNQPWAREVYRPLPPNIQR